MEAINAPKGVPDYVPPRSRDFYTVQEQLSAPARLSGYEYIELPVFEATELFERGVGASTDVVQKEMYTFTDRGDRSITLRPEGTAGVMRAVIENRLDKGSLPAKLWYRGPFFRAERPQHGRYRQLQQVGVEVIGSVDPIIDAEVIAIADQAYRSLGLRISIWISLPLVARIVGLLIGSCCRNFSHGAISTRRLALEPNSIRYGCWTTSERLY